jgi:cytochrome c
MPRSSVLLNASIALVVILALQPKPVSHAADAPRGDAAPDPAMVAKGQGLFAANCAECHSIAKDGAAINAPNLWGLMGKKVGSKDDFPYSDALAQSQIVWSTAELDKWIESPPTFIPGNAMPFVGIKDPSERQSLIAFIIKRASEE